MHLQSFIFSQKPCRHWHTVDKQTVKGQRKMAELMHYQIRLPACPIMSSNQIRLPACPITSSHQIRLPACPITSSHQIRLPACPITVSHQINALPTAVYAAPTKDHPLYTNIT